MPAMPDYILVKEIEMNERVMGIFGRPEVLAEVLRYFSTKERTAVALFMNKA